MGTFQVQTKDKHGNTNDAPTASIIANARRADATTTNPTVFGTVTYEGTTFPPMHLISITFPDRGDYILMATLGGKDIGTGIAAPNGGELVSPATVTVSAAAAVPGNTQIFVPDEPAAVGEPAVRYIWLSILNSSVFQVKRFSCLAGWIQA